MQLMPSLQVKQKQSLVMTPQLQQAIKLLQMTNLDIAAFLQEQALENPFIEFEGGEDAPALSDAASVDLPAAEADAPLATTADDTTLDRAMSEGAAIADDPTVNADVENRYESASLDYGREQRGAPADTDWDALANLAETGPESLVEFVLRQIDLTIFEARDRVVAYALAEALEPSGWLGRPLQDIAEVCGCDVAEVESVLETLQRLEPEGVFARDLAECLRIQARERDILDPVMIVVLDNLDVLANGDLQQLARRASAETEDIAAALRLIREMNPKPGEAYEAAPLRVHAPDVVVSAAT